jgi:plastocyanin
MLMRYIALPALLIASLLLVSCGDDEEVTPDGQTDEPAETIEVEMTLEDFSFAPTSIDADLGDEVFVELANDGEQEHTFTISEFLVDETLDSGQDTDVTFVPNEAGEFTYFCRNHPETMQGTITIAAPGAAADPTSEPDTSPTEDDYEGPGAGVGY